EQLAGRLRELDLVLLDLGLPGCVGVDALTSFRRRFPRVACIVVSARDDRDCIVASFKAGASGYVPKNSPSRVIIAALRLVMSGGIYIPRQVLSYVEASVERPSGSRLNAVLTDRQRQVLRLLLQGRRNGQIAHELQISE